MQSSLFANVNPYFFLPRFAFSDESIPSYILNISFLCSRNVLNTIIETFRSLIFLFLDYEQLKIVTNDVTVESGKASNVDFYLKKNSDK
jgi:hypothetical protein